MSKVRTFMRTFPKAHISEYKPTYFVELILNGLKVDYTDDSYFQLLLSLNSHNISIGKLSNEDVKSFHLSLQKVSGEKIHTIRNGFNIKQGENISPRIWFGIPYHSPQIIIWHDLQVMNCQIFNIDKSYNWFIDNNIVSNETQMLLSKNDGLKINDMKSWFNKEFNGQIICWKNTIHY